MTRPRQLNSERQFGGSAHDKFSGSSRSRRESIKRDAAQSRGGKYASAHLGGESSARFSGGTNFASKGAVCWLSGLILDVPSFVSAAGEQRAERRRPLIARAANARGRAAQVFDSDDRSSTLGKGAK